MSGQRKMLNASRTLINNYEAELYRSHENNEYKNTYKENKYGF